VLSVRFFGGSLLKLIPGLTGASYTLKYAQYWNPHHSGFAGGQRKLRGDPGFAKRLLATTKWSGKLLMVNGISPAESTQAGPILSISRASFGYAVEPIVEIEKLEVQSHEVVALVGPSGCGKTTVLSTIAGMREPIAGSLEILGTPRAARWRAQHTARTVQGFPLFHWLTVRQNLELASKIRGMPGNQVDGLLEQFSASHLANRYPKGLSGGERCRASLAQAAVASPKLALLDEPFTGLDSLVKEDVAGSLFAFAKNNRIGVLLVTHDMNDAVSYSQRVVVLGGVLGGRPIARVLAEVDTSRSSALETIQQLLRRYANDR
jgi:NitT/TauT family transport system ATP-binding protein